MAAPSRQERLQMRQRGAGARKVNNVDFGFSFGSTPARVERSARRVPQPSNASISRSSKTPSRGNRQSSAQRSVRSASATSNGREYLLDRSIVLPEDNGAHTEESAAKRRKTKNGDPSDPMSLAGYINPLLTHAGASMERISFTNLKPRRRISGPAVVQIAEDPEDKTESENPAEHASPRNEFIPPVPEPAIEIAAPDKENDAPDEEYGDETPFTSAKQKRKSKKRRSIGQQSGRRKKRLSKASIQSPTEEPLRDDATPEPVDKDPEWETIIGEDSNSVPEQSSKTTTPSNAAGQKRRKRKSVVLKPRKRRRSGESNLQSAVNLTEVPHHMIAGARSPIDRNALAAEPTLSIRVDSVARRSPSEANNVELLRDWPTYEPEIEGDETYIDQASPEKPTPKARPKKAKNKSRKSRRSGSSVQSPSSGAANNSCVKKSSKCTFPILTHRMTNIDALPSVAEEGEDNSDLPSNLNSIKSKFADRSAPNAIDVLAQICRETISNTISKLSASLGTRELNRKRKALEAFSSEIDSRLFDMSVAIEHRLAMEGRVKKAKKAKTDAQNEWIAIRREREEIALKCDAIRARNQMMEAEGKGMYELSERLHELEMLVEKPALEGEGVVSEDLEYTLRSVAMTVSGSLGAGKGLLAQVKDFNRQLERTALLLEGRELD